MTTTLTPIARESTTLPTSRLDFELDEELAAREPVEATPGAGRNDVRLMVSDGDEPPEHRRFDDLPTVLRAGDLLVVNSSATMAAALDGSADDQPVRLHISTQLPSSLWLVEVRTPTSDGASIPDFSDREGQTIVTDGGLEAKLLSRLDGSERLWVASLRWPRSAGSLVEHLARHGRPIRYGYVRNDHPLAAYQTVFGRHPGSAEMPSASRPFTDEIVTSLVMAGVALAPITLHTGVSSLEAHEMPYPERFDVPAPTARLVNHVRESGGRVIAVGTTVVRALESAVDELGEVHPAHGWADVIVTPDRGARSVDGLLTGWHEPQASHLLMLEAIGSLPALIAAYDEAIASRYRWHEFGDVHLILR